jgi:uncharacterized membrane protein (UPF0136 family)
MTNFSKYFWIVFGLFCVAGGWMGYSKAGSIASLIAGGIAGLLLVVAGIRSGKAPKMASLLALVVSLLLLGRFIPAYLKEKKPMPAIPIIVLALCSVAVAGIRLNGLKKA